MAKASFTLSNGTTVLIEGSPDEIRKILSLYQAPGGQKTSEKDLTKTTKEKAHKSKQKDKLNIADLINAFKESGDVELIEKNILDRTGQIDRILLPLYIAHKEFPNQYPLTTAEIAQFLSQLGTPIFQSNIAVALSSTVSKYVMGDKVRKRGRAVRYKLSRRGFQYLNTIIHGKNNK
ncbi:MAG: hypothetical protein KAV87_56095 [Desulfobacteraceae bacterium]|nr:hypothetical protein [Desulfobacteraceae bacterium]